MRIGNLSCKNLEDVINVGTDLCSFDFKPYQAKHVFSNKGFVGGVLEVGDHFSPIPHLEDYWEDHLIEREFQRSHSRMVLSQVLAFKIKLNLRGVQENGSKVVEHEYLK